MICTPDGTSVLPSHATFQTLQDGSVYSDKGFKHEWHEVINKIQSMFGYQPDWDDEGSLPPSDLTISRALHYVLTIQNAGPSPQLVYANVNREIVFEWHTHSQVRTIAFFEHEDPKQSSRYKTLAR